MRVETPKPDAYRLKSDGYPQSYVVDLFKCLSCKETGFWMPDMEFCPYCGQKIKHYETVERHNRATARGDDD